MPFRREQLLAEEWERERAMNSSGEAEGVKCGSRLVFFQGKHYKSNVGGVGLGLGFEVLYVG
ncbi:hypothetical protein RchiOBHm_Chr5g0008781 [Rosa chinensis]|uniref:Uncharacterized protein n=1 Tax=Rosa chinensis TaxID=74649 RepID=A0A2P6Q460_ROSCH|nr:hypothetical protein RchiOBHm_Chr5g0008781 [Rosa chinensis]